MSADKRLVYKLRDAAKLSRYTEVDLLQKAVAGKITILLRRDKILKVALIKENISAYGRLVMDERKYLLAVALPDFVSIPVEMIRSIVECGEAEVSCVNVAPGFEFSVDDKSISEIDRVFSKLFFVSFGDKKPSVMSDVSSYIASASVSVKQLWVPASDIDELLCSLDKIRPHRGESSIVCAYRWIVDKDFAGKVPTSKEMWCALAKYVGHEIGTVKIANNSAGELVWSCSETNRSGFITETNMPSRLKSISRSKKINRD